MATKKSAVCNKVSSKKESKCKAACKAPAKKAAVKSCSSTTAQPDISLIVTHTFDYTSKGFKRGSSRTLKFDSCEQKGKTVYLPITPRINRRLTGKIIAAALSLGTKTFDVKQEKVGTKGYKITVYSGKKSIDFVTKTKILAI